MMKHYLIVLLFTLLFYSHSTSQSSNRDINEVIFHALDVLLREELRKGNEHFPILAPFESLEEFITFRVGHLVNLTGVARNVYIDGLDGYSVIDSRFSKLTMRLAFDIVWPQVLMTGWYNLNGRFGGLIPIYGQGNYRIDLKNFRAKGYATIQYIGPRNNLNMTDLSVRINEQSLNMKIEGILGGGDLGELINKAAQDSVPVLLIRNEWEISNAIKDFLLPRLNPFLNEFSFEDLENRMP